MKILVIGGSYFLGRAFTMLASKENELTLINRGTYSMQRYGVKEYKLDRRDAKALQMLPYEHYDAVVDFCGYYPGDIRMLLENLPGLLQKNAKYVFVSTVDAYERNVGYVKDENTPLSNVRYGGENGDYIYGKICLEKELKEVCDDIGMDYTIIRPSIIYGPNNYAREHEYAFVEKIVRGEAIEYPKDAEAKFQMVYVKDVAEAVIAACKKTPSRAYNVCPNEYIDYEIYAKMLQKVSDIPVILEAIPMQLAIDKNELVPFPLTKEENELYNGQRSIEELGITYTSLEEGMRKTFNATKQDVIYDMQRNNR